MFIQMLSRKGDVSVESTLLMVGQAVIFISWHEEGVAYVCRWLFKAGFHMETGATVLWSEDHLWPQFWSELPWLKINLEFAIITREWPWFEWVSAVFCKSLRCKTMSKICILTITTSITSLGLMFYHQMYGFGSFSSQKVNEAVNSFWSSQWSEGQVIKI